MNSIYSAAFCESAALREYPLSLLTTFAASSPNGTPLSCVGNFAAQKKHPQPDGCGCFFAYGFNG